MLVCMSLGDRIRKRREELAMEQAELARRVGSVPTTAWRWEHDKTYPKPSDLERIAKVLDVSVEWLEGGSETRPRTPQEIFLSEYKRLDELRERGLLDAVLTYCGRQLRAKRWTDYERIADITLDAAPSETFETKKRSRG